jgi:hypothetical protein
MSMAMLRRYPQLTAVVVDFANVCSVGREIAAENGLEDRISYHPADFLKDALPSGSEMILECDVGVYSEALFRKVRAAMEPGGRFVIVDHLAPEEGVGPPSRVQWAFRGSLGDPDFCFATAARIREILAETGFELLSERTLPAVTGAANRFTRNVVLIEARS